MIYLENALVFYNAISNDFSHFGVQGKPNKIHHAKEKKDKGAAKVE